MIRTQRARAKRKPTARKAKVSPESTIGEPEQEKEVGMVEAVPGEADRWILAMTRPCDDDNMKSEAVLDSGSEEYRRAVQREAQGDQ